MLFLLTSLLDFKSWQISLWLGKPTMDCILFDRDHDQAPPPPNIVEYKTQPQHWENTQIYNLSLKSPPPNIWVCTHKKFEYVLKLFEIPLHLSQVRTQAFIWSFMYSSIFQCWFHNEFHPNYNKFFNSSN